VKRSDLGSADGHVAADRMALVSSRNLSMAHSTKDSGMWPS
jgi:hypothetical protein